MTDISIAIAGRYWRSTPPLPPAVIKVLTDVSAHMMQLLDALRNDQSNVAIAALLRANLGMTLTVCAEVLDGDEWRPVTGADTISLDMDQMLEIAEFTTGVASDRHQYLQGAATAELQVYRAQGGMLS